MNSVSNAMNIAPKANLVFSIYSNTRGTSWQRNKSQHVTPNDLIRYTENQNHNSANIMLTFKNDLQLSIFSFCINFNFFLTVLFFYHKGRDTQCDKSLWHIAATSRLVCTDAATSRCDKTLVQCTQSILKERKCKLFQTWHGVKLIDASSLVDFKFCCSDLLQMHTHAATRLLALILSLWYVTQIQNSVAATMIFTCHTDTSRFVAATCRGDVSHCVSRP